MNKNGNQDLAKHLSSVENSHRTNTLAIDLSTIYGRDNTPNRLEMPALRTAVDTALQADWMLDSSWVKSPGTDTHLNLKVRQWCR